MIALLLAATLLVTPEQPVSDRHGVVPVPSWSYPIRSASNGQMLLAVWCDYRGAQAARFDSAGRRLDAQSLGLPLQSLPQAVFWNGEHWVVLTYDDFVRVGSDGKLLDRSPRTLDIDPVDPLELRAVWTGSVALIVTREAPDYPNPGLDLEITRFDRDMNRIDDIVLKPRRSRSSLALASNGSSAILFYRDGDDYDLHAVWFDRFGQLQREELLAPTVGDNLGIGAIAATDGSGYALLYGRGDTSYRGLLFGSELDPTTIRPFTAGAWLSNLLFDGGAWTAYLTRGEALTEVLTVRIAPDGTMDLPVPAFRFSRAAATSLHVAAASGTTLAFHFESGPEHTVVPKVRTASSPEGLAAAAPADLATGVVPQTVPVSVAGATQSVVAWREELLPKDAAILATRVDGRGQVLDPQSIALGQTKCTGVYRSNGSLSPAKMAAASDGRDVLVAWRETEALAGAIVRADGTAQPVRIFDETSACNDLPLVLASNGSLHLMLWAMPEHADRFRIKILRVASDGTALDAQPVTFLSKIQPPLIASDGTDFLVVTGDDARRMTADGALLDPREIDLKQLALAVWWNGATYIVATREEDGVRLITIDRSGAVSIEALHPWTDFASITATTPRCDAGGCSFASYVDGAWRIARIEESGIRVESIPKSFAEGDVPPRDVSLAGNFLVYNRRVLDLGNAWRVFFSRIATMRGRAVRH